MKIAIKIVFSQWSYAPSKQQWKMIHYVFCIVFPRICPIKTIEKKKTIGIPLQQLNIQV